MQLKEWLSTDLGQSIWKNKYRNGSEELEEWFDRMSGGNKEIRQLIVQKKFLFGGRTLANRGLNNGSYSNCYSSGYVPDSLDEILRINTNLGLTYKAHGGQGVSLSKIRPKGTLIGNRYESDGILPIMELYNTTTSSVSQAGARKGALMISIDIKHKESETFMTVKSDLNKINKANLSLEIDDDFMLMVESDYKTGKESVMSITRTYEGQTIDYDITPIKLYKLMIKQAWLSAEPGVLFVDKFRNYNLMEFVDSYQIETCNPCLHPDSIVETSEGKVKIKDMTKSMMVYSMDNETKKLVLKKATPSWISKKDAETIKLHINNGEVLTCTPDHKIYIEKKGWIEAQDIKIGDSPIALLRRRRGVKYSGVRLSSQKAGSDIMEHRFVYFGNNGDTSCDIHHLDGDTYNNSIDNLECLSHSEHSTVTRFECDNNHQIKGEGGKFISSGAKKKKTIIPLPENLSTGFKSKPRIVAISEGEKTDVYDITVEDTHNFVADGIIVHNCGEQPLPKDGACNLGSLNLSEYVNWEGEFFATEFKKDVRKSVRALDEIIDENYPNHALENQREMARRFRNIGLGIMGYGDALIKLRLTYGSQESKDWTWYLMEMLFKEAVYASVDLASEKGTFPEYVPEVFDASIFNGLFTDDEIEYFKMTGIRNCSLLSIAPTGTLGSMLNISTGMEPNFALKYKRKTEALDNGSEKTFEVFAGIAEEYTNKYKTDKLPDYFVTSHDLNWRDRVDLQAICQKYVDTAISSTINLSNNVSVAEVEELYLYAWQKGLKGATIYRDGCREGILSLSDTPTPKTSENFFERGDVLDAEVVHFNNDGTPWVAFLGTKGGKPFEIFSGPANLETFPIPKSIIKGKILKVKGEESTRYDFRYIEEYGYENTLGGLSRIFDKEYYNYARLISGMLRSQIDIPSIINIVDGMHFESQSLHSWKNGVIRSLKSFVTDGTITTDKCPEKGCDGNMVYIGGCKQCDSCGISKC